MASTSRTTILPQSKEALLKSYNARLKDDVRSMLENFEGKHKIELTIKRRGRTRLLMYHGKSGSLPSATPCPLKAQTLCTYQHFSCKHGLVPSSAGTMATA